jgi:hypothetical protein
MSHNRNPKPPYSPQFRESAHHLGANLVRGAEHPWAHAGQDDTEVCAPQSRHPLGCGQFGHGCIGWGVCAYGVGKPCWAGAVGSVI